MGGSSKGHISISSGKVLALHFYFLNLFYKEIFLLRFFHAAEVVGRKIVIHGGWDGSQVFNDTWIFNTDTFVWIQVNNCCKFIDIFLLIIA